MVVGSVIQLRLARDNGQGRIALFRRGEEVFGPMAQALLR